MIIIKNITSSILSLTILITSFGIPINYHFCQDRLIDIKLFSQPIPCKEKNVHLTHNCHEKTYCLNQDENNGCCHNHHELIKLKNIQNAISHIELIKLFSVSQLNFGPYFFRFANTLKTYFSPLHDPPFIQTDRVIEFHSFLI